MRRRPQLIGDFPCKSRAKVVRIARLLHDFCTTFYRLAASHSAARPQQFFYELNLVVSLEFAV